MQFCLVWFCQVLPYPLQSHTYLGHHRSLRHQSDLKLLTVPLVSLTTSQERCSPSAGSDRTPPRQSCFLSGRWRITVSITALLVLVIQVRHVTGWSLLLETTSRSLRHIVGDKKEFLLMSQIFTVFNFEITCEDTSKNKGSSTNICSYLCIAWNRRERLCINLSRGNQNRSFHGWVARKSLPVFLNDVNEITQMQMGKVKSNKGLKNHRCGRIHNWTCSNLFSIQVDQPWKESWSKSPFTSIYPSHQIEMSIYLMIWPEVGCVMNLCHNFDIRHDVVGGMINWVLTVRPTGSL